MVAFRGLNNLIDMLGVLGYVFNTCILCTRWPLSLSKDTVIYISSYSL